MGNGHYSFLSDLPFPWFSGVNTSLLLCGPIGVVNLGKHEK